MIKSLISIKLRSMLFGSFSGKDKKGNFKAVSKGKTVLFIFLYVYLALTFGLMAFFTAMSSASVMVPLGASDVFFGLLLLASFTSIFILSIFETKSELFECKDNELLLSLPIKPSHIVIARSFSVLILNYLIGAIVIVPSVIAYLICGGSPVGIFGALFVLLTVVPAATALSSGVGYLVAEISKKMKHKTLVTVLMSVLFLAVYFVFYFVFLGSIDKFVEEGEQIIASLLENLRPIAVIGSVFFFELIPTFVYTAFAVAIIVLFFVIISKNYLKVATSTSTSHKKVYTARFVGRRSAFVALCDKEFRRFLSSANYILNGGIGVIFAVVLTLVAAVNARQILDIGVITFDGSTVFSINTLIQPVGVALVVFFFSMNMMSCSALSLEGENFWTLKSLPISEAQMLLSKTVPQIVISAPISGICGLIIAIAYHVEPVYFIFYILTPIAVNILMAFVGILINVLLPKFNFTSEIEVIKQAMAVFITMLADTVLSLAILGVSFVGVFTDNALLTSILTLAVILALNLVCYYLIIGPAAKRVRGLTP